MDIIAKQTAKVHNFRPGRFTILCSPEGTDLPAGDIEGYSGVTDTLHQDPTGRFLLYGMDLLISRIDISCIDFLFNIQKLSIHAIRHNYPTFADKLRPILYDLAAQKTRIF